MNDPKESDSLGSKKDSLQERTRTNSKKGRIQERTRIGIELEPDGLRGRINGKSFQFDLASGDIRDFNDAIINILDKLRNDVQKKGVDLTGERNYLEDLREIGLAAYNKILSDDSMQSRFHQEDLKNPTLPPRLTLSASMNFNLIWEILYSGDPSGKVDPECFWGFYYPLGRYVWETNIIHIINLREGILAGVHNELRASSQEVEHLRANLNSLDLALKMTLLDQALAADALSSDTLMELFGDQHFPYGIIHFACHCNNPTHSGASNASLMLTVHNQDLEFSPLDLLRHKKKGFFKHEPFIFINACETQNLGHLLQTISLPGALLDFQAGSVIATACTMPDTFASAFASVFYQLLLAGPDPPAEIGKVLEATELTAESYSLEHLADVLLATRRYFLKRYNNPLGLAYGLYAVAGQKVRLL